MSGAEFLVLIVLLVTITVLIIVNINYRKKMPRYRALEAFRNVLLVAMRDDVPYRNSGALQKVVDDFIGTYGTILGEKIGSKLLTECLGLAYSLNQIYALLTQAQGLSSKQSVEEIIEDIRWHIKNFEKLCSEAYCFEISFDKSVLVKIETQLRAGYLAEAKKLLAQLGKNLTAAVEPLRQLTNMITLAGTTTEELEVPSAVSQAMSSIITLADNIAPKRNPADDED